ncbi:MAG: endonuclease/exonuclease/phosphatase family protein [Acidobacteriota bacterium]
MPNRIRLTFALMVAAVLAFVAPAATAANDKDAVTVMTWNLYFGFDEAGLFSASPEEIPGAVSAAWAQIHATDFRLRAAAIAKKVRATQPDLFAVQEAVQYVKLNGGTFEPMEVIDYIQILVEALATEGLAYQPVNVLEDTSVTLPDAEGNYVQLLDRTAILARTDLPPGHFKLSNPMKATFSTLAPLCLGSECIAVKRGWVSVDVKIRSARFRFVTAHLEDAGEVPNPFIEQYFQIPQAQELVATFPSNMPVILAGDFNTDGYQKWATYQYFTGPARDGAAMKDAWLAANPRQLGLTWGPDPNLLAPYPPFTQRLDLVLLRGAFRVVSADVVGDERSDRTSTGMWPSDHAGVVATLVP